jgi:2'-5' RNA ligase
MARLRTFIAVDLGKPIRERIVLLQESLARTGNEVKWVEPENIHLTLLFLGEVDDRELISVCRAVSDVGKWLAPFVISVEQIGCFPNLRRPRILWVGVGTGAPEVVALHDALEPPLLALGCYRREDRPYTPHITCGRARGDAISFKLTEAIAKKSDWQAGETEVGEVLVMSSELTPKGPIYTVLSRAKLGE